MARGEMARSIARGAFYLTPELATLIPILVLMVAFDAFGATGRSTMVGIQQYRWVAGLSIFYNLGKALLVGGLWWARRGLPELAAGLVALSILHGLLSV